jgi:hypothetical protein
MNSQIFGLCRQGQQAGKTKQNSQPHRIFLIKDQEAECMSAESCARDMSVRKQI